MRSWLWGRSLTGAWIRLFVLALLPLFLTATAVTVYQAKTIPGRVREGSQHWVAADQLLVDSVILFHRDLVVRMAKGSEGQPAQATAKMMAEEMQRRRILLGMAWIPDLGEPVLTERLETLWSDLRVKIASNAEPFQLVSLPSAGESLLVITERRATGKQISVMMLDQIARELTAPEETGRWFALADSTGYELAMHDPTVQLRGVEDVVSVRLPSLMAPGWAFIGYTDAQPFMAEARAQLWSAIGFALCSLLAGLALVIPAARNLLKPMRRLREVARSLPAADQVAAGELTQHESAVALVDQLEDRLLYLEEEHTHFFSEADVPFCIVSWEGKLLELNQAWCRLIGYPADYFRDHRISDTLHPGERLRVADQFPELQTRSMTVSWTWHHLSATREDLWINWSVTSDVERGLFYAVCRNVTHERTQERHRLFQSTLQQHWLIAKSGAGVQAQLDAMIESLGALFPQASFAFWEEPDNGRWLLRTGSPKVHPESSSLSFEIPGELVRFGLLAVQSEMPLASEEESFLKNLAEMIGTAVKQEQESVRLQIQHGINQLLAEAEGISDLFARLLPLISRPMNGVAARLWAPASSNQLQVLADWAEQASEIGPEAFGMHQWIVHQTLADGHPRWIAEGTRLPHRPDEMMPVGRITFAVRVGVRVVGCVDCLVPVLRTPEAGFLTLLDSLGAQIGLYMERRLAEEERAQQAHVAAVRADVMDLVASGASLESVLERVCLLAEALLPQIWTLSVFYDAKPDRPLILAGPSCPPDRMTQFHGILATPGSHEIMRRWSGPCFMDSPPAITAALPLFGSPLLEMGVRSCWVWPVPIPPSNGTLLFGFYTAVEGGLSNRHESVLTEVSHLAQMAVERWWLEEALSRRVDLLLEHMQEGLVAVDGDAQVVQTNPAARRILKLSTPWLGRNGVGVLPDPLAEVFRRAVLPDAQPFPATMKVDGAPVYAYVSPVRSEEGVLLGAIAILEDSTLRHQFQQLQTALVANVSHDLKAPLAALGALVESIASQQLPPDLQQQYLGSMRDEIARLRRLTNDLLLLARLDAGLLELEPEVLEMGDLLQGLAEAWAPRCHAHGITLTVTGEPVAVWADYDRVIQILTNLLDNAVKFTPSGGSIQLGLEPAEAGRVRIFVRDTGQGIGPEHLEKLGSRFYMVDQARERTNATGTGLGLSIVRALAERMRGQMRIESTIGGGTTVWLELAAPASLV
ncbi:MAG TPA: ATP-binding protein [Symbiobacteriaceae bacterium]|nr:ATP-binding protein [Symbiobacteriaceae bacterium]